MPKKSKKQKYILIVQALSAAESSINLAKQLLADIAGEKALQPPRPQISAKDLPGIMGKFDGVYMVDEKGNKYEVPQNYASKSLLVYGDVLKMIEENGLKRFKQIERVKRQRVEGILAQKDGKFCVVTGDGSYNVLEATVKFFGLKVGDEIIVVLPLANKHVPFAAIEGKRGKKEKEKEKEKAEAKDIKDIKDIKKIEEEKGETKKMVKKEVAAKKPAVKKTPPPTRKRVAKKEEKKEEPEKKVESMEIPEEDELR